MQLHEYVRTRFNTDRDTPRVVEPLAIPNFKPLGSRAGTISPPGKVKTGPGLLHSCFLLPGAGTISTGQPSGKP
jgi:hypothetical protein